VISSKDSIHMKFSMTGQSDNFKSPGGRRGRDCMVVAIRG